MWKDTIWSFYTLQIGEVLLKRAVYEIEHGMRAEEDFPKDKNLEQKCSGKGGIMIELGSKALFFINLIIQAVAKCGGREGLRRQRLLDFLLDYLRAEQERSHGACYDKTLSSRRVKCEALRHHHPTRNRVVTYIKWL